MAEVTVEWTIPGTLFRRRVKVLSAFGSSMTERDIQTRQRIEEYWEIRV